MSFIPDFSNGEGEDDILNKRPPWMTPPRVMDSRSLATPAVTPVAPQPTVASPSQSTLGAPPPTSGLGTVIGNKTSATPVPHHEGDSTSTLGNKDLAGEFDTLRKSMPTRDQFKQPELKTWQKIGIPIAAAATELGNDLRRGGTPGLGAKQMEAGWNSPETRQNDLYDSAIGDWEKKGKSLETEVRLGKDEAEAKKLGQPAPPHYMDTAQGPVGVTGTQATPITDSTTGQPIGPKPGSATAPISPEEKPRRQQDIQDRRDAYFPEKKGRPLEPNLTLRDNATEKDYQDALTAITGTGSAAATGAQRIESNKRAEQTQKDTEEKAGREWVQWIDPKTGKTAAGPASLAKQMGVQNAGKLDSQEQVKMESARAFLPLSQRALETIDKLDQEGKLGVLASRWNDFKAGKIGNEPDFAPIRVLTGLDTTLLMNLHVGNRGGSYLMEHFEDLANSGKMNAATLRAAIDEERRYAHDRAMVPEGQPIAGDTQGVGSQQAEPEYDINGNPVKHQ